MNSTLEILDPRNNRLRIHAFAERYVFSVMNVTIEPNHGNVYSENGNLIAEGSAWDAMTAYNSFPFSPTSVGEIDFLERFIYLRSCSFWHWVIEELPPFLHLVSLFPDVKIVVAQTRPSYVDDILTALNLHFVEIADVTSFSEILMIEFASDSGWPHPEDLRILESHPLFSNQLEPLPSRLIYISRRNSTRSASNENELEALLKLRSFEIVTLEDLALLDKVKLFRNTSVLVGLHGAGLVGMVWMAAGTTVIDIANENYWTESAHRLANMKNLNYQYHIYQGSLEDEVNILDFQQLLADNSL